MHPLLFISLLLGLSTSTLAAPTQRQSICKKAEHKPWQMLTPSEQAGYIEGELCLMKTPSKLGVEGAVSLWDDLQWNHIVQTHFVHDVGQFLPWHRYYMVIHRRLLEDECGYNGPLPYWDETADSFLDELMDSPIFGPNFFGGTGKGRDRYITDGPFANYTLHLQRPGVAPREYHISRTLDIRWLSGASQANLDACFQVDTYDAAWQCWQGDTHGGGHTAVSGFGFDVLLSPADPMFYMHHSWLDAMWWKWQTLDLPHRLTDMGGRNVPSRSFLQGLNLETPGPEWTDYDGDDMNVTTLNHVLYASEIYPNVTVGDIMDVGGDVVCAEYFFSDSFNVTTT